MTEPFVGEIRMFAGERAPSGWVKCEGQFLPISQNEELFCIIGTIYGGDGKESFALPDLRGRVPIHHGRGQGTKTEYRWGQTGGTETVKLTQAQLPSHTHAVYIEGEPDEDAPTWSRTRTEQPPFVVGTPSVNKYSVKSVGNTGRGEPYDNMPPFLCVTFIIALKGKYPSYDW